MDDHAERCAIVVGLDLSLGDPAGQIDPGVVLALDDHPVTPEPDATDVALVLGPGLDPAVDPVVQVLGEVVGDLTLEG